MSDPTAVGAGITGRLHDPNEPGRLREQGREHEDAENRDDKPRSLLTDAWDDLRHSAVFWVSLTLVVIFVTMAIFPQLFTHKDPLQCDAANSVGPPSKQAYFGYDIQGCDVYARTVYGARASIAVGFAATIVALVLGAGVGVYAGYYGGVTDTLLSRITDIFFAIPVLLGSIIVLSAFPTNERASQTIAISKVALALAILGWTATARQARASVIQVKHADYVLAARSLGASNWRIIRRHIIPNSLAPIIVLTTISLGAFIGAEATLSYLGIGLQPPLVSWGIAISDGQEYIQTYPNLVFFPALFLSLTVLGFIMLGDAIREALDPKLN